MQERPWGIHAATAQRSGVQLHVIGARATFIASAAKRFERSSLQHRSLRQRRLVEARSVEGAPWRSDDGASDGETEISIFIRLSSGLCAALRACVNAARRCACAGHGPLDDETQGPRARRRRRARLRRTAYLRRGETLLATNENIFVGGGDSALRIGAREASTARLGQGEARTLE